MHLVAQFETPWTVLLQAPLSMGILQARILQWVAMTSSRASSPPSDQTQVSRIAGRFFTIWTTAEALSHIWKKVKEKATQSCPPLCDHMDYTVRGILQARILEWVAFPFSRGSSQPRNRTGVSCIAGRFSTNWPIREAPHHMYICPYFFLEKSIFIYDIYISILYKVYLYINTSIHCHRCRGILMCLNTTSAKMMWEQTTLVKFPNKHNLPSIYQEATFLKNWHCFKTIQTLKKWLGSRVQ